MNEPDAHLCASMYGHVTITYDFIDQCQSMIFFIRSCPGDHHRRSGLPSESRLFLFVPDGHYLGSNGMVGS